MIDWICLIVLIIIVLGMILRVRIIGEWVMYNYVIFILILWVNFWSVIFVFEYCFFYVKIIKVGGYLNVLYFMLIFLWIS